MNECVGGGSLSVFGQPSSFLPPSLTLVGPGEVRGVQERGMGDQTKVWVVGDVEWMLSLQGRTDMVGCGGMIVKWGEDEDTEGMRGQ